MVVKVESCSHVDSESSLKVPKTKYYTNNTMLYFVLFVLFCPASSALVDDYFHSLYLDFNKTYHLSWRLNETHIEFHTNAKTLGYVALGMSMDGSLKNADVFIAGVSNKQPYSSNYHGDADEKLVLQKPSKWHLMNSNETETETILTFCRQITGPDMVMNITENTMRVLWGYGRTDNVSDSFTPDGAKSLYLLQEKMPDPVMPNNTKEIEFKMNETLIPKKKTTYWCKSFAAPSLESEVHAIVLSPYIQEGHEGLVHHMLLYGCYKNSSTKKKIGVESECYTSNMPPDWIGCRAVVYAWAIGGSKLVLPEHIGLSVGGEDGPLFYILEIHYDNPQEKEGLLDSSGMILTVTEIKRRYEIGILEMGYRVESSFPQQIPPYTKEFKYHAFCEGCESMIKPKGNVQWNENGVKMIGIVLHAHLTARQILLHHYRNGEKLPDIAYDRNYDFNYQEMRLLKKEITFLKDDVLHVECIYDTSEKNQFTYGGLSTSDEMCLAYVVYYPRIQLTNCHSVVTYNKTLLRKDPMLYKNNEDAVKKFELIVNGLEPKIGFRQYCDGANTSAVFEKRLFTVPSPYSQTTVLSTTKKVNENNSAANYFLKTGIIFLLIICWLI